MIRPSRPRTQRRGLSLLEVLIALAIFLLSLAALNQLVNFASDSAIDASRRNHAGRLAQSKLNSVISGVIALSSQGDAPFDSDETPDDGSNYSWSVDAEQNEIPNLWSVTVTVSWDKASDSTTRDSIAVSQMILDPSIRGSTQDSTPVLTSPPSDTSSSPSSSSTTPAATTPTPASSAAATPAKAAATPAKSNTPAAATSTKSSTPAATPTKAAASTPTKVG